MTAAAFQIIEDTRQQVALPWPAGVEVTQETLREGDFTTPRLRGRAAIELKREDTSMRRAV